MNFFPTKWQQVIFRNYGKVKTERLAKVLCTDSKTVKENAVLLGLDKIKYNPVWIKKGFVTLIRLNWDLLTNDDICTLLEMKKSELNESLKEYDFLDVKLGDKPKTDKIKYKKLTEPEYNKTLKIREIIKENYIKPKAKPFDFYKDFPKSKVFSKYNKDNFTASFSAKYSGALLDDKLSDYNERYLKKLKAAGITGIWLSDTLRNLAPFPFDKKLSRDYKIRIKNLKKLTERCDKFGVGVYLYINEPRSLKKEFFDKYPSLKGQKTNSGEYCLCTSQKEVKDYLYNAVKFIAENVPKLKGLMTITMSENPTHCYSVKWDNVKYRETNCPYCKDRKPEEITAEICNIYAKALKDGNGYTKLIANLWGWSPFMGWTEKDAINGIKLLDKDVEVLCVSEYDKKFTIGGIENNVVDYSISKVGPSDLTVHLLNKAKQTGHKIWAKVQMNNSWECSGVPYLPTFDLMAQHIDNVNKLGVKGIMLGWSLGGYPGGVLPLINSDKTKRAEWYKKTFKKNADGVKKASKIFSEAFKEYPFSVDGIYFGAHTLSVANLWNIKKDKRKSTMVCFAFDDEEWAKPYGLDIYISQYKKMLDKWEKGFKSLNEKGNSAFNEYKRNAYASFYQLKSTYNFAYFTKLKKDYKKNKKEILKLIEVEKDCTLKLYSLISEDAKIGFEMTNHYYYNGNALLEKLLNLQYLKEKI